MKQLTSNSRRTINQINRHPTTHDLEWGDIRKMFEEVGDAEAEHNGNLKVTLSGKTLVFQSPQDTKVATEEEIHDIRRLMHGTGFQDSKPPHLLLVIDHQSAKLYRTVFAGSIPELVVPFDPEGHKGHVHGKHEYNAHAHPASHNVYFEDVAQILVGVEPLILFGSGEGSSSTMNTFVLWLKEHHPKVSERIVQTVDIDASHLTEGELLEKARNLFAQ